ncbi:hypothetical protein [Lyngbya confervoides]|nr:hypothetical protein [Lyngbya confervoides]
MSDPQEKPKKAPIILDVDAGTLLLVIAVMLLAPLLFTGFFSH